MRNVFRLALLTVLFGVSSTTTASEENQVEASEGLKATLKVLNVNLSEVQSTPVAGVLEATSPDGTILYVTEDGKHVFSGDLHSIEGRKAKNLTEESRSMVRRELIAQLTDDETLNFAPKETKHIVYAFTDVDCSYCRVLHREIEDYAAEGIEIRYLAYPRAGVESDSYRNMVSAWCASDPKDALTKLKQGKSIELEQCDNPIASHVELGRKLSISGTPTLVLENGHLIGGYLPAHRLKQALTQEQF